MLDRAEAAPSAAGEGERPEAKAAVEGSLEEAVLENSNQFYRWHSGGNHPAMGRREGGKGGMRVSSFWTLHDSLGSCDSEAAIL